MSSNWYTAEFRAEAIRQVMERGYPVSEVAGRLGVSTNSMYKWLKGVSKTPRLVAQEDLRAENARLKSELKRVEEEGDILKKATAYFAKASGYRSLRPRFPVRKRRRSAVLQGSRSDPQHESPGQLLRQRRGGIVFQQFEERADTEENLSVARGGTCGRVRLHRGLLQPESPAQSPRSSESVRLRTGSPNTGLGAEGYLDGLFAVGDHGGATLAILGEMDDPGPDLRFCDAPLVVSRAAHSGSHNKFRATCDLPRVALSGFGSKGRTRSERAADE